MKQPTTKNFRKQARLKTTLPPPAVTEAAGNSLPSTAPMATVVVPASANLRNRDLIIVKWEGLAGDGTVISYPLPVSADAAGKPYAHIIPATAIAANAERTVQVSYEVVRANGGGRELSVVFLLRISSGMGTEPTVHDFADDTIVTIPVGESATLGNVVVGPVGEYQFVKTTGAALSIHTMHAYVINGRVPIHFPDGPATTSSIDIQFADVTGYSVINWEKTDGTQDVIQIPDGSSVVTLLDPAGASFRVGIGAGNTVAYGEILRIILKS